MIKARPSAPLPLLGWRLIMNEVLKDAVFCPWYTRKLFFNNTLPDLFVRGNCGLIVSGVTCKAPELIEELSIMKLPPSLLESKDGKLITESQAVSPTKIAEMAANIIARRKPIKFNTGTTQIRWQAERFKIQSGGGDELNLPVVASISRCYELRPGNDRNHKRMIRNTGAVSEVIRSYEDGLELHDPCHNEILAGYAGTKRRIDYFSFSLPAMHFLF